MPDHDQNFPVERIVLLHELLHQTPRLTQETDATSLTSRELAVVLAQYDLGPITSIRPLLRGSRQAPKVVIEAAGRRYLLKRRAPGRDDPVHVAMCHGAMLDLGDRGFPVPALVGTRSGNNSMLQLAGRVYELVSYYEGSGFDASAGSCTIAGLMLGRLHTLLASIHLPYRAPVGSYHRAERVEDRLDQIVVMTTGNASAHDDAVTIRRAYIEAGKQARDAGLAGESRQLVHGDWHPGNAIFEGQTIIAVLDFDSLCIAAPACDLANGALQYALRAPVPGADLANWPIGLDADRLGAFLSGYAREAPISAVTAQALASLMIEALIAEAAEPLAETGRFGPLDGPAFLGIIRRQIAWLRDHAEPITRGAHDAIEPKTGTNRADGIDPGTTT